MNNSFKGKIFQRHLVVIGFPAYYSSITSEEESEILIEVMILSL
jgi:hypothetical protein